MKVLLVGSGRMGHEIKALAHQYNSEINMCVDPSSGLQIFNDFTLVERLGIDVAIDFSHPDVTPYLLKWCERTHCPLVSGTTGIGKQMDSLMKSVGLTIPVFWSSNMSLGVALVTRMLSVFAHFNNFDFQIEETHHRQKIDRPSGTALSLQHALEASIGRQVDSPVSLRLGEVFGIHKILAVGHDESIEIIHQAYNRRVFAVGALMVAQWLIEYRRPGYYQMEDFLSLSCHSSTGPRS